MPSGKFQVVCQKLVCANFEVESDIFNQINCRYRIICKGGFERIPGRLYPSQTGMAPRGGELRHCGRAEPPRK